MQRQAERFGAEFMLAEATGFDLAGDIKTVHTNKGDYRCFGILLATGAHPRTVGFKGEEEYKGRGVAYCASCDGMFYKGKTVVVAGGGNSAAADALLLSRLCEKVIVVHRRDTLRATKIYHKPLMEAENVEFRWNSTISKVLEDGKVSGILIRDNVTGEESVVEAQGIFVSIGRKPASALVAGQVELDAGGYIVADESTKTTISGVFAVGDVRTKALRQIVTAVADGAVAAHYADEYLAEK
jgi:thioredoxin reductase (NADPH)